jgi:hypothetical protein
MEFDRVFASNPAFPKYWLPQSATKPGDRAADPISFVAGVLYFEGLGGSYSLGR